MDSRPFEFTWKIANFGMLPHQNGELLTSPYFTAGYTSDNVGEWCLWLYPRGESRNKESLACFVCRKKVNNASKIKVRATLTIQCAISKYNTIRTLKEIEYPHNEVSWGWGFNNFLPWKKIYDNKDIFLLQDVLTLKCQMWFTGSIAVPELKEDAGKVQESFLSDSACITRIEVNKRYVTWPITKIKERVEYKSKTSFQVESALENTPAFKLLFHFSEDSNCEYAQIAIHQTKTFPPKKVPFVKCKITVISPHKEYQHSREDTFLFSSKTEETWNFPEFVKIADMSDDKYLHLDNTLYLSLEFSFSCGKQVSHAEIATYSTKTFQATKDPQSRTMSHLTNKIQNLYMSKKFCDVTLRVGEQSFPAHKVVLCAQSPVFSSMFENDMKEKNTNVVDIEDVEPNILELVLEFLHSNVMKEGLSMEDILELYSAADKYQIALLKHQCAILILSSLSIENVCEVLIMADRRNDHLLLTQVHHFLKMHTVEVFHSPQWNTLFDQDPELCGSVMIQVFKNS